MQNEERKQRYSWRQCNRVIVITGGRGRICIISLLAFLILLRVRDSWAGDSLEWFHGSWLVGFTSMDGMLLAYQGHSAPWLPNLDGEGPRYDSGSPVRPFGREGSCVTESGLFICDAWGANFNGVAIENWKLAAICGLLLARPRLLAREKQSREHRLQQDLEWSGICPACGYDLRGTPKRCPECGAGYQLNLPQ